MVSHFYNSVVIYPCIHVYVTTVFHFSDNKSVNGSNVATATSSRAWIITALMKLTAQLIDAKQGMLNNGIIGSGYVFILLRWVMSCQVELDPCRLCCLYWPRYNLSIWHKPVKCVCCFLCSRCYIIYRVLYLYSLALLYSRSHVIRILCQLICNKEHTNFWNLLRCVVWILSPVPWYLRLHLINAVLTDP